MRRTSLGTAVLALTITFSTAALGTPEIQMQFTKVCKPKAGSKLAMTQCTSCHVKMAEKPLNRFGTDVKAEMARQKSKIFTAAVWKKVAVRDSDGDKVKNGAEVVAGTLPGDAKSKP